MNAPTITREALVRAARLTIAEARENVDVPPSLAREVMKVARTATHVCADWRSADDSCGCLIGTRYGRPIFSVARGWVHNRDAKWEIGFCFPHNLWEATVGWAWDDAPVEVIE